MIDKIFEAFIELYKNKWNKEINKNEDVEEVLKEKSKDDLLRIILLYKTCNTKSEIDIIDFKNKKKEELIKYIYNNLEEIIINILIKSREDIYEQLINLSLDNGYYCIELGDESIYKYSIAFANYLSDTYFGKVYYDKDKNTVELFLPKKVTTIINKSSKDKKIMNSNKKYNKKNEFLISLIETFGILELDELYGLMQEYNITDDVEELFNLVLLAINNEEICMVNYNNLELVYSIGFENEKDAKDYYKKICRLPINDNLSYSDIIKIGNREYIEKFDEYKDLIDYLLYNYDLTDEDIEDIKFEIIDDYFYSRRIDKKLAEELYRKKLREEFDIDPIIENILFNKIEKIYEKMPKWEKRGFI